MHLRHKNVLGKFVLAILILYWVGLCIMTHIPHLQAPAYVKQNYSTIWGFRIDKIAHVGAYALLSFLLSAWWSIRKRKPGLWDSFFIAVILLGYGGLEEITQKYFGRGCELGDWIADGVGVTIGLVACQIVWYLKRAHYNPRFEKPRFISANDLNPRGMAKM